MNIQYGFIYKDSNGERKVAQYNHSCCFGGLQTAWGSVPVAYLGSIEPKVVLSTELTYAEFQHWWGRLVKEIPTFKSNGVEYPAPKAVYYDKGSKKFGALNHGFPTQRAYTIITFPKKWSTGLMYIALKFYFKNLCMPKVTISGRKMSTADLWKEAEGLLIGAGVEKPNMLAIMALNSGLGSPRTMGYGWPIAATVWTPALKKFLTEGYECTDWVDNTPKITAGFNMFAPKNAVKDISQWLSGRPRRPAEELTELWTAGARKIKELLE